MFCALIRVKTAIHAAHRIQVKVFSQKMKHMTVLTSNITSEYDSICNTSLIEQCAPYCMTKTSKDTKPI